jgi:hypothetical protein
MWSPTRSGFARNELERASLLLYVGAISGVPARRRLQPLFVL